MSQPVISVRNVSKCYRLGVIGGRTLREDVNRWWARKRGKPDPYARIGDDYSQQGSINGEIWALRDINLDVEEGEILGIIGGNGAGKSTLLKVLSRITAPTSGHAVIKGRVGSLLEVGTGFHQELTGRENVYLNGAILGMNRSEVGRKLDAIIDFAEVATFVDTPVKRYSSGMLVRLAFAVAAHLEPEILIVDEVLAVGDSRFQKKCLAKMEEVAKVGRTILFVSHNMQTIASLCPKAALLREGMVSNIGEANDIINEYLKEGGEQGGFTAFSTESLTMKRTAARYCSSDEDRLKMEIDIDVGCHEDIDDLMLDFVVSNERGVRVFEANARARNDKPWSVEKGANLEYRLKVETTKLSPGRYFGSLYAYSLIRGALLHKTDILLLELVYTSDEDQDRYARTKAVMVPSYGVELSVSEG